MPDSSAKRQPGDKSHARWLTANRVLRLYVATESQDESFFLLVNSILKVYTKIWFRKKCMLQVQNGFVRLFIMLNALRYFDDSRTASVVIIIAYASSHSRKNSIFFVLFFMIGDLKILC